MGYHIQGCGNADNKRASHGCEKNWNRYDEPFRHMIGNKPKTSKRWLSYKRKKDAYLED
jgi:hypothetical protein